MNRWSRHVAKFLVAATALTLYETTSCNINIDPEAADALAGVLDGLSNLQININDPFQNNQATTYQGG